MHEGKESQPSGSGSLVNEDEVEFVLALYGKLVSSYPELKSSSRVAIITTYSYQVKLFREKFRSTFSVEPDTLVDIKTIDGFQVGVFNCQIICIFLERYHPCPGLCIVLLLGLNGQSCTLSCYFHSI